MSNVAFCCECRSDRPGNSEGADGPTSAEEVSGPSRAGVQCKRGVSSSHGGICQRRVAPGERPSPAALPGPPQIRTCGTTASGSSVRGFATRGERAC